MTQTIVLQPLQNRKYLEGLRAKCRIIADSIEQNRPLPIKDLKSFGRELWAVGLDRTAVLAALAEARRSGSTARLVIVGDDPLVMDVPWELLYDDHDEIGFIAINPHCSVTRRLLPDVGPPLRKSAGPLRVLVFNSSPEDLQPDTERLDYEREQEAILAALDGRSGADFDHPEQFLDRELMQVAS